MEGVERTCCAGRGGGCICVGLAYFYGQSTNILLQLGTFGRAKRKVEEMQNVIAESRRAGH